VRTSIVVGTPRPPAAGQPKTVYPANIIAVPGTGRVVVRLTGARMHKGGFQPVRSERLVVSVAPDSMPLRDEVDLLPVQQFYTENDDPPHVLVEATPTDNRQIVDIAWCLFKGENNPIHLDVLEMRGDTLHVGVVAHRSRPVMYSGPGTFRPHIRFNAPKSARVVVHIRRLGMPITKQDKLVDFESFTAGKLEVTVEHRPSAKRAARTRGFGQAR